MRQRVDRPVGPFTRPRRAANRYESYNGDEVIDGLPTYHQGKAPDHLLTQHQLDELGKKRADGQGPVAWLWVSRPSSGRISGQPYTHWTPVALYDRAEAVEKQLRSARQREVLAAARAQAETCRALGPDAYKVVATSHDTRD